jgi:hypothetical protein
MALGWWIHCWRIWFIDSIFLFFGQECGSTCTCSCLRFETYVCTSWRSLSPHLIRSWMAWLTATGGCRILVERQLSDCNSLLGSNPLTTKQATKTTGVRINQQPEWGATTARWGTSWIYVLQVWHKLVETSVKNVLFEYFHDPELLDLVCHEMLCLYHFV